MTDLIGEFNVLKKMDRQDEATALLRKIASQVKPIMKKRGWKVKILQEFFPTNPALLGLNVNHGYKICIRLRPHYDSKMFLPYESLLGTMLHELTHIVRGPHDQQFYKILDELTTECENLVLSGYTGEGFDGPGQRLGVHVSHDLPPHLARETALDAAEKRRRTTEIMIPAGGRRLGGSAGHLEKVFSPRELAAMAAERRVKDSLWCGSGNEEGTVKEDVQGVGGYVRGVGEDMRVAGGEGSVLGKRKAPLRELEVERLGVTAVAASGRSVKQEAWGEWSCPSCTLVNRGMALQCECCLEKRPEPEDGFGFEEEKVEAVVDVGVGLEWECPRCTLMNGRDIIMCIACEFLRDE